MLKTFQLEEERGSEHIQLRSTMRRGAPTESEKTKLACSILLEQLTRHCLSSDRPHRTSIEDELHGSSVLPTGLSIQPVPKDS